MPLIIVDEFFWDEDNLEKIAQHGLRSWEIDEVLSGIYVVDENRAGRAAPYLLIGQNESNDCIAVPIQETMEPGVWRPVTAWRCKRAEWARLGQFRGRG